MHRGGAYCAERGLGWKAYGAFYAAFFGLGVVLFMPAAATYTICDGFKNALGIPMWVSALVIALAMAVVVMGGVKRISSVASMLVPPEEAMNAIVPNYVAGFIYGALVESFCSEQNARMMAMDAATDNADALLKDLNTMYNRARQAAITQEITEVCGGAAAQRREREEEMRV